MKVKSPFQIYIDYKARKLREKTIKLALKTDCQSQSIVGLANDIESYIKSGEL